MSETMQVRMWGKADLVIPASKGQQLALFQAQGPGATLELPNGQPVPAAVPGMLQGTLAMTERPPAETWPDPDVIEPDYETMRQAAVDWQYLTAKHGGMARKSELDRWLADRYGLDACQAHEISNSVDVDRSFIIGRDGITWTAQRPEPTREDYPGLVVKPYGRR